MTLRYDGHLTATPGGERAGNYVSSDPTTFPPHVHVTMRGPNGGWKGAVTLSPQAARKLADELNIAAMEAERGPAIDKTIHAWPWTEPMRVTMLDGSERVGRLKHRGKATFALDDSIHSTRYIDVAQVGPA